MKWISNIYDPNRADGIEREKLRVENKRLEDINKELEEENERLRVELSIAERQIRDLCYD